MLAEALVFGSNHGVLQVRGDGGKRHHVAVLCEVGRQKRAVGVEELCLLGRSHDLQIGGQIIEVLLRSTR